MTAPATADVCLVLEGTYPFVPGGVSSWVHQLTSSLPELQFSILHITPRPGFYADHAYTIPANVVSLEETFLQRPGDTANSDADAVRGFATVFCDFIDGLCDLSTAGFADLATALVAAGGRPPAAKPVLLSDHSWRILVDRYRREAESESFQNFFWNWCFIHEPLVNVLRQPLPRARLYHTISTGYAGFLAALARLCHRAPMMLTEHGIYNKERRIEIASAEWIPDGKGGGMMLDVTAPYFRRLWNRNFAMLSRICYEHADHIYTLYGGNKDEQIRDGANPEIIDVVPNGIDVERFAETAARHRQRGADAAFTVGFVGRVCPIKDLRTFVAAMRLVADQIPELRVRVLGPMEEDPDYAADCQQLASDLGLGERLRFEGKKQLTEELDDLDVLVMTSISEAQPLVVLEAGAVGIPAVCTDVGCCRELLEGRTAEDRALGPGGKITPIATPGATAKAVVELWANPELRRSMGESLQERVERFYSQRAMIDTYRAAYQRLLTPVEPLAGGRR